MFTKGEVLEKQKQIDESRSMQDFTTLLQTRKQSLEALKVSLQLKVFIKVCLEEFYDEQLKIQKHHSTELVLVLISLLHLTIFV